MKQTNQPHTPSHRSNRQSEYWYDDEEMRWAIQQWATRIGVKAPHVRFQMMPTQWGTITPSGWLTLDPMLLTLPKNLGEFVIVHELVHLLVPTHGKLFKLFMHAYMPDWEDRERELQGYGGVKGS
jgi:predicted metal-dependent hydrolase